MPFAVVHGKDSDLLERCQLSRVRAVHAPVGSAGWCVRREHVAFA